MASRTILGIDEAGRGPVIGPLVMCGFLISEDKEPLLRRMGVKDSKMLSARKRDYLAKKLEEIADDLVVLKLSAAEIDSRRSITNLNKLEIEKMQSIIALFKPKKAIVDAIEANTEKFRRKINVKGVKIVAENFADKNHPVVGAASIIAKFYREKEVRELHKIYGDFGSGYPNDPKTINFLKKWIKDNTQFPADVRSSWVTAIEMKKEKEQQNLNSFIGD